MFWKLINQFRVQTLSSTRNTEIKQDNNHRNTETTKLIRKWIFNNKRKYVERRQISTKTTRKIQNWILRLGNKLKIKALLRSSYGKTAKPIETQILIRYITIKEREIQERFNKKTMLYHRVLSALYIRSYRAKNQWRIKIEELEVSEMEYLSRN